jgi:nucleoside-diphosphate kinase
MSAPTMAIQRTLSMIKPDAMEKNHAGAILAKFQEAGFTVRGMKMIRLSLAQAEGFYGEHKARGFFGELVDFMTSGPVVLQVLEGENAVAAHREVMGATDPAKAADGTVRKLYGANVGENAVHGSDSEASAAREISYFFAGCDLV